MYILVRFFSLSFLLFKITRLHIPRHAGQLHHQPVQILRHLDLAPQPRRLRQPKRQVQHVVLVVVGLLHLVVQIRILDYDVARRTRARPSTGAW